MLPTVLFIAAIGAALGALVRPFGYRNIITGSVMGLGVGAVVGFLNIYPASIRGVAQVLVFAAVFAAVIANGSRITTTADRRRVQAPVAVAVGLAATLILTGLVPFTAWGASSQDEPVYNGLMTTSSTAAAPTVTGPADFRVVPWQVASQLLVRGYGADASWLDTSPGILLFNTWPDTVRGEFVWVNAPQPEGAKWFLGGQRADKVLYVKNDPNDLTPTVVNATLNVHRDGIWWQHRVDRYALNEGEFRWQAVDTALQLDDDDTPFWIAYLARIDLRGQQHLEKLLIVNGVTGEDRLLDLADAPPWLEIVYPETYVNNWVRYWGLHREGLLHRVFNAQGLMEPDDVTVRYVRLQGQPYWLMPMRQLASPQLGGYVLVDTRSGEATFFDRFDRALVDYDTAVQQLAAIMASGEATRGQGQIRLQIAEGYLYPVTMADGAVRDAYVFPLLEGLKVSRFAVIDAVDYTTRRVFASTIADALGAFSNGSLPAPSASANTFRAQVLDGAIHSDRVIANLNGTLYRVTTSDLAAGSRAEPDREMDELVYAVTRANRGEDAFVTVRLAGTRVVDVTLEGAAWGGPP